MNSEPCIEIEYQKGDIVEVLNGNENYIGQRFYVSDFLEDEKFKPYFDRENYVTVLCESPYSYEGKMFFSKRQVMLYKKHLPGEQK